MSCSVDTKNLKVYYNYENNSLNNKKMHINYVKNSQNPELHKIKFHLLNLVILKRILCHLALSMTQQDWYENALAYEPWL